jgi:tRNA(Ile)-lysidine synthase
MPLLPRIADFANRHAVFAPGGRIGIAVSGGADSVFLLHALHELAPRWNLHLSVVHIEHGIRGDASLADAEFVRNLAASFGLAFHLHEANVTADPDNLEQAARRARTEFYRSLINAGTVDRIATGHTRSDQAETVLYRILRGSGLAGLAGILPVTDDGQIRPLLELTRAEIEAWLRERGIAWREDETNQDRAYARNRLRHEILPNLTENFNPRLDDALANLATLARDEEAHWHSVVDRHLAGIALGSPLVIPTALLNAAPPALARRLTRRLIEHAKGDLRQIDFAHVERILEMARSPEGHDRVQIPTLDVIRSFEWLRFCKLTTQPPRPDFSLALTAPGSVELPGDHSRIVLQVLEKADRVPPYVTVVNELDWEQIRGSNGAAPGLEVRNWRPGDQYRRVGQPTEEKIKHLFQEARVPLWERRNWPIITYNGVILWTRRFGAAAAFAAGPSTRITLRVDESGSEVRTDPGPSGV